MFRLGELDTRRQQLVVLSGSLNGVMWVEGGRRWSKWYWPYLPVRGAGVYAYDPEKATMDL